MIKKLQQEAAAAKEAEEEEAGTEAETPDVPENVKSTAFCLRLRHNLLILLRS